MWINKFTQFLKNVFLKVLRYLSKYLLFSSCNFLATSTFPSRTLRIGFTCKRVPTIADAAGRDVYKRQPFSVWARKGNPAGQRPAGGSPPGAGRIPMCIRDRPVYGRAGRGGGLFPVPVLWGYGSFVCRRGRAGLRRPVLRNLR